jgi:predicted MPP superfamily phosphohydrolase
MSRAQAVNLLKFNRRRFLALALLGTPLLAVSESRLLEPKWVRVRRLRLGTDQPSHRFIHFSDVHHKGDRAYLQFVVGKINELSPEFVCFTGDLIEETAHLAEALEILGGIKAPLYGVPGNHDYWSRAPFETITKCFSASGGAWLLDQQRVTQDGRFSILGAACLSAKQPPMALNPNTRNLFLMHYPAWVENLGTRKHDLILAGHSHGGQVRLPLFGPVLLPFGVGKYDLGLFRTQAGPLYVNAGIGWFQVPIRFNCRPEITVFEV